MAKLADYEFKKLGQQIVDFHEDTRDILNNGKVAHSIVSGVPAWNADNGEMAFYENVAGSNPTRRIYVRLSSSWVVFAASGINAGNFLGFAGGNPGGNDTFVQINSGGAFGADTGFTYLFTPSQIAIIGRRLTVGGNAIPDQPFDLVDEPTALNAADSLSAIELINAKVVSTDTSNIYQTAILGYLDHQPTGTDTFYSRELHGVTGALSVSGGNRIIYGNDFMSAVYGGAKLFTALTNAGTGIITGVAGRAFVIGTGSSKLIAGGKFSAYHVSSGITHTMAGVVIPSLGGEAIGTVFNTFGVWVESPLTTGSTSNIAIYAQPTSDDNDLVWSHLGNRVSIGGFSGTGAVGATTKPSATLQVNPMLPSNRVSSVEVIAFLSTTANGPASYYTLSDNVVLNAERFNQFISPLIRAVNTLNSIGTASTVYINAAPIAGSNNTIYNSYALWVDSGDVRFDNRLVIEQDKTAMKVGGVIFTTTAFNVASNNASAVTLLRAIAGTTSLTANTFSEGRTIRLQAWGYYNAPLVPDNLRLSVLLGTTTMLTTGDQTPTASASSLGWSLNAFITCQTTGGAGTVFAQGAADLQSSVTALNSWEMVNSSNITLNTTGANVIQLIATYATAGSASQFFLTNAVGELLN